MKTANEILKERIAQRLDELQLTERAVSLAATGKPDLVRFIRTRGTVPSADKIIALAAVLECSAAWLMGKSDDPTPGEDMKPIIERFGGRDRAPAAEAEDRKHRRELADEVVNHYNQAAAKQGRRTFEEIAGLAPHEIAALPPQIRLPRDVPVYGTAIGGAVALATSDDGKTAIEQTDLISSDVIDYFRRPPGLANKKKAYGLYVTGGSMEPVFEPGSPIIVDPGRTPSIRDYVVVYLRNAVEEDDEIVKVLVKRLARRSASFIELEQFNPPSTFRVPLQDVASMHRVMPLSDIIGI